MADTAPTPSPSPFASILSWSVNWPEWQRDALRRIITGPGLLSETDLKELAAICRAKHGLLPATGTVPAAVPLPAAEAPGGADGTASISLCKLYGVQNVGRLPDDQEVIFGASTGLTVIYGENGAGKSGYARVIKKACLARGMPQDIKPDAFATGTAGPAMAKIAFRADAAELTFDWRDGVPSDPRLGNIFVFDSLSAQFHVREDGPACFKPRGLDVLPELAKACDAIKAELQKELDATIALNATAAQSWKYSVSTAVGKLINAVGAATQPEAIDAAAAFAEDDERRLVDIVATLSTDPKRKAADTAAAAKRIRTFADIAKNRAASVDDIAMQNLSDAIKDAETTAKAATAASGPELKPGDLPWGGNDVWRELWKAAQQFSETAAYIGKPFPFTEADAKCVLCHQPLHTDAVDRYDRFNKFVANETRKQAEVAKTKVADLKKGVDLLRAIGIDASDIKVDLDREAAGSFDGAESFAKAVDARIAHAQKCLKEGTWTDAPVLPDSTCAELVTLAETLDRRAKEEEAAADPKKKQELERERDELADQKWLASKKDDVKTQIDRHKHAAKLEKCRNDCTTNDITIKSGELHKSYVTDTFCKAFEEELALLGMKTLGVRLEVTKGAKGERKFGVRLVDLSKTPHMTVSAKVSEIASEGEHRCIALAAFMAELSLASHKSALVFDDPVSSLDHKRREEIAKRLVREAGVRQVIVFTHDLAFVCDLERAAGDAKKHFAYRQIERIGDRPGRVLPHLAWQYKSDEQQIKEIKDLIARAVRVKAEQGETEYREAAQVIINRLRGACERLIEQTLLRGAVKRHDSQIFVSRTPGIAAVTQAHWNVIHEVWKSCSNTTDSHAAAFSGPKRVPTPEEFAASVKAIEQVLDEVEKARTHATSPGVAELKTAVAPSVQH